MDDFPGAGLGATKVLGPPRGAIAFIPLYPDRLPSVPKPSRVGRTPSSVIINLGRSRGTITRLENRYTRKGIEGSNPSSSATKPQALLELETTANLSCEQGLYPNLSQWGNCLPRRSAK